jgi:hypothetical protein
MEISPAGTAEFHTLAFSRPLGTGRYVPSSTQDCVLGYFQALLSKLSPATASRVALSSLLPVHKAWGAPYPRFPVRFSGFRKPHAPFLKERRTRCLVQCHVQEIRGISLVFREMWDTTAFNLRTLKPYRHISWKFVVSHVSHVARNSTSYRSYGAIQLSTGLPLKLHLFPKL